MQNKFSVYLAYAGNWMRDHRKVILGIQWAIVLIYAVLIIVPCFYPVPDNDARILNNITVFAQFCFWGIWWPFVLLSMIFLGRFWCGVMCPEGALTEWAAKHSVGRPIPKWMRWGGWPFVAFALTTIYGQLVSVYQYPWAVLLVLGGSTVAAIVVGFIYAKQKRAWCKYLCPVNGVFALLSKLAPVYYKVDQSAWDANLQHEKANLIKVAPVNCAPLQPLRSMQGASGCHMCGRCSGYHNAIDLTFRSPTDEVVRLGASEATFWQMMLIIYGLLGIAIGAFHWTVSPIFIDYKLMLAEFFVDHEIWWILDTNTPWFLLTNYPENNDVFSWLDGLCILTYILGTAAVLGSSILVCITSAVATVGQISKQRIYHLAQAFIPIAGAGVFLGLSATTLSLIKHEGIKTWWANDIRLGILLVSSLAVAWLGFKILKLWSSGIRLVLSFAWLLAGLALVNIAWGYMFWWW
ncbi:4Fe-4S binding protein [Pseudomonas sp. F1_0610]|uniref:4Fe-4S binding protein n=1 Tax=Pseudomonas sp. F1_0610 TaxID=3114284 RepID=UPI0039C3D18B